MGNAFSGTPLAYRGKKLPMTMARWQNEMDGYTRKLADQKELLAALISGQFPTLINMSLINFNTGQMGKNSMGGKTLTGQMVLNNYKRITREHIKLTEQKIAEHMAKKPVMPSQTRQRQVGQRQTTSQRQVGQRQQRRK